MAPLCFFIFISALLQLLYAANTPNNLVPKDVNRQDDSDSIQIVHQPKKLYPCVFTIGEPTPYLDSLQICYDVSPEPGSILFTGTLRFAQTIVPVRRNLNRVYLTTSINDWDASEEIVCTRTDDMARIPAPITLRFDIFPSKRD